MSAASGPISNPVIDDTDVDRVHTVLSPSGELTQLYTAMADPLNLAISATNAENAHFTVLFGDGHGQTVCGGMSDVLRKSVVPNQCTYKAISR